MSARSLLIPALLLACVLAIFWALLLGSTPMPPNAGARSPDRLRPTPETVQ